MAKISLFQSGKNFLDIAEKLDQNSSSVFIVFVWSQLDGGKVEQFSIVLTSK